MILHRSLTLFALCFLLVAQAHTVPKDIYIDPTTTASSPAGTITEPFQSLSAAFDDAQAFISQNPLEHPLAITFQIKEDTVLSLDQAETSLSLDGTDRLPSTIKLVSYEAQGGQVSKPAIIRATNPSAHVSFMIPKVKFVFEKVNFEFNVEGTMNKPEIILVDGKDSEVIFSNCAFQNSKVNSPVTEASMIALNTGRYLFKNCQFIQLDLNNALIQHQGPDSSMIKYELNQFHDITVKGSGSVIRVANAATCDFLSNKAEKTTGRLIEVTKTTNTIISDNTFTDVVGQYPVYLNTVKKIIAGKNTISYAASEHATHEGFLSIANFNILGISDTNISGYFGLSSAISIASDSANQVPHTPMVIIHSLTFNKNKLCVHDEQVESGIALINMNLKQKTLISIESTVFGENTFYDMREHPVGRSQGASTLWIQAVDSSLKLKKTSLKNNKADRALSNLYISVGELDVVSSIFTANTLLEGAEASKNTDASVTFSNFGWYAEDLTFTDDLFTENYNDFGGAISIREAEGLRIPQYVTIENSTFINNKAKEGGAIYYKVTSQSLESFQFENNVFERNQATVDPDYSESLRKSAQAKPRLFMEIISQSEKRVYVSGEFTMDEVESGKETGYSMEFYISDHKNTKPQQYKQYYASISMKSSKSGEAYLVNNFTDKVTGPSVMVSGFSVVAPVGSLNVVRFTMRNKEDPNEQYTFEFKITMKLPSGNPRDCKRGEVFAEKEQVCVKCPSGTYSLTANAASCRRCVLGADCSQGGDQIKILPGFWRDTVETELFVYPCVNKEKCLGGAENTCAEGHAGPLCEACNTKDNNLGIYRPFLRNTCKSCNSKDIWEIVGDIIGLTAPIGILLYTAKTVMGPKSKDGSVKQFSWCLYTNVFISYVQNLFVLGVLDYVPLPHIFNYVINVIANPSLPVFGYLTCYFPGLVTYNRAYLAIFSLFAAIPFMKVLLIVIMAKMVASRGTALKSTLLGLMWLGFLEAPGILDFCLRFFDCKQVGNWVYSPFFLDFHCDARGFELLRTVILVPAVLLITVVCPLIVCYTLSKGSMRSDEVENYKNLRVMMLARSADNIGKSHRSWLFFYFAGFGRLGLLLLSTSTTSSFGFSAIALYYGALLMFNKPRKILVFKGWRSELLFVDAAMVLISALLGYGVEYVSGNVKSVVLTALWVGNVIYLLSVNLCGSTAGENEAYGKLKEENVSSSEEAENGENKRNPEHLDETV